MRRIARAPVGALVAARVAALPGPRRGTLFAALVAATMACGGRESAGSGAGVDSATRLAIRAESVNAAAVAARPPSALWDAERVSERLFRAGVGPRRIEPVPPAPVFFAGASAAAFAVARGAEVRVFVFADSASRVVVTNALDPLTVAPPGARFRWPSEPLLIVSGNLAAVMLGGSSVQRERVQLALEAGLPSQ